MIELLRCCQATSRKHRRYRTDGGRDGTTGARLPAHTVDELVVRRPTRIRVDTSFRRGQKSPMAYAPTIAGTHQRVRVASPQVHFLIRACSPVICIDV